MTAPTHDTSAALDTFVTGPAGKLSVRARGIRAGVPSAVVLVQGALLSGQTAYDIPVGPPDLALLQVLAGLGHAAVTFSIRGYGESDCPADPLSITTEDAMDDLHAVVEWTRAQTGLERVSVFGWSWGGRVAGRYVETHADLVDRLVLMDPALGGTDPIPDSHPEPWKELTAEEYRSRVEPAHTDPEINELVALYAARTDLRAPMGVAKEAVAGPVMVRPEAVTRPTLMIYGATAARADYMQGRVPREVFFGALATDDRSFVIVPDAGDYMQFQRGRFRLHEHLALFLAPALSGGAA